MQVPLSGFLHVTIYGLALSCVGLHLLLIVLQGWLNLQAFLQVVECCVLQSTVADQVIQLMPRLYYVKV